MHQKIEEPLTKSAVEMLRREIRIAMLATIVSLGTIVALVEKFFS